MSPDTYEALLRACVIGSACGLALVLVGVAGIVEHRRAGKAMSWEATTPGDGLMDIADASGTVPE